MLHSEMHGRWGADGPELRHRELCAEMLEALAAGDARPYPFGDALYLLDAMRPRAAIPAASGRRPFRRLAQRALRFLTSPRRRHRMGQPGGEALCDERSRPTDLPVRGVPA